MKNSIVIAIMLVTLVSIVQAAPSIGVPSQVTLTFEGETGRQFFSISNNGDSNLTNLTLVRTSDYSLQFSDGSGFSNALEFSLLQPGETVNITAQASVPGGEFPVSIGRATISSLENVTKSINFVPSFGTHLMIDNVEVDVDGKTKHVDAGETVNNIEPGAKLDIQFDVINTFNRSSSIDLNDIIVEVRIKDIDNGDDDISDDDIGDINAGRDDTVTFSFHLPDESDEDTYTVEITAFGDDDIGIRHETKFTFFIEVDKQSHDVRIYRTELTSSILQCDRTTFLSVTLKNFGSNEEDSAALRIDNSALNIHESEFDIDLDNDGFRDESEYDHTISISVPESTSPGDYSISIKAFRDDDRLEDEGQVVLTVRECILPIPSAPVPPPQPIVVPPEIPPKPTSQTR